MNLDEKDMQILELLKQDSKLTTSKISKKTRIPITTIHNRIKKLEAQRIIKNYTVNLDYEKLGKSISATILITAKYNLETGKKTRQDKLALKIKMIDDVEFVKIVTGGSDMIVSVRTNNINELNKLITEKLRNIEGIDKTQTMITLNEI